MGWRRHWWLPLSSIGKRAGRIGGREGGREGGKDDDAVIMQLLALRFPLPIFGCCDFDSMSCYCT